MCYILYNEEMLQGILSVAVGSLLKRIGWEGARNSVRSKSLRASRRSAMDVLRLLERE